MTWLHMMIWAIWIIWGGLSLTGLWILRQLHRNIDQEFEEHWTGDREFSVVGYLIIIGWIIFSVIWLTFESRAYFI